MKTLRDIQVDCDKVQCSCCGNCSGIGSPPSATPFNQTLFQLVESLSPDGGQALHDVASPQYAAFQWLQSSVNSGITNQQTLVQRYALASLYYSTYGDKWFNSTGWLSKTDECKWFSSQSGASICDSNGKYTDLDLHGNNLSGTLPLEIVLLSDSLGE